MAVGPPRELHGHQEAALLVFLKALARAELQAEQARCRLCKLGSFDPHEAFKTLQGDSAGQKSCIGARDMLPWLAVQSHILATATLEDVTTILAPFANFMGEVKFEGFMRMLLPRDPGNAWLKDATLTRGPQPTYSVQAGGGPGLSAEAAYALCEVLKVEQDLHRDTRYHSDNLRAQGVGNHEVMCFLDAEQGACAGMGGLIAPRAVRHFLVDTMQSLSGPQCDAFLRRINPRGAGLVPFVELAKYLSRGAQKPDALLSHVNLAAPAAHPSGSTGHYPVSPPARSAGGSGGFSLDYAPSPAAHSNGTSGVLVADHAAAPTVHCIGLSGPIADGLASPRPRSPGPSAWGTPLPNVPKIPTSWREQTPPRHASARTWASPAYCGAPEPATSLGPTPGRSPHAAPWRGDSMERTRSSLGGGAPSEWSSERTRSPWPPMGRPYNHVTWRTDPAGQAAAFGKLSPDARAPYTPSTRASSHDGPEGMSPRMPRERWGYSRSHGQALSATLHHHCPTGRTTPEHTNTYDGPAAYHRGSAGRLPPESTFLGQSSPMALHHQGPTGCAPPEQTFDPRGHSRGELLGGSPRRAGSVPPVGGTGGYALRESGGNATARWGSPIASYEDFRDSQASLADMARAKYDAGASSPEREDFVRATLETMLGQANVDVRSPAAGENLERERRRLVAMPGHSIFSFDDVFNRISSGKPAFSLEDLRVAYVKYGISISEHELALLLHRYAPHGEVTFPDFLRQVKPRFY